MAKEETRLWKSIQRAQTHLVLSKKGYIVLQLKKIPGGGLFVSPFFVVP